MQQGKEQREAVHFTSSHEQQRFYDQYKQSCRQPRRQQSKKDSIFKLAITTFGLKHAATVRIEFCAPS
eukprot:3864210-Amphidinium_carterae.1